MISFGQNVVKVCILVPAKPHGPENSVAGDWRTQGRVHATDKLEISENDEFPEIFEFKGRSVGSERLQNDFNEKNHAERWIQIQKSLQKINFVVG